jgi:hypothetical protein
MRSHAPPEADWEGIAGGFVDNPLGGAGSLGCVIAGLPTNPPAHHQQPKRTDDSRYKADIFTRYRQAARERRGPPARPPRAAGRDGCVRWSQALAPQSCGGRWGGPVYSPNHCNAAV